MAFLLFVLIFYYHPKTYSGLLPFRTISVVAQTRGPVTEINVVNGQRVSKGDVLFRIEDSSQKAALAEAQAQFDLLTAEEAKAADALVAAKASVTQAEATLNKFQVDLDNAITLVNKQVGTQDAVRKLEAQVTAAESSVTTAKAQLDVAQTDLSQSLPAERKAAEAAVNSAQVELDYTVVKNLTDGTVTQLSLGVGSPATTLILSPAMVIIPDRPVGAPVRIVAGFSQVARATLYNGMPAEIACDSNIGLTFRNSVMPAHVVGIQPAISAGQILPGARLLDPSQLASRGSILVYFELEHPDHVDLMLDGSGCMIQTYTANLKGTFGHIIAATGIVKAFGLRLKVWGSLISGIGLAGGGGH